MGPQRIHRVLKTYGLRAELPRSFVPRTPGSDPAGRAHRIAALANDGPRRK